MHMRRMRWSTDQCELGGGIGVTIPREKLSPGGDDGSILLGWELGVSGRLGRVGERETGRNPAKKAFFLAGATEFQ